VYVYVLVYVNVCVNDINIVLRCYYYYYYYDYVFIMLWQFKVVSCADMLLQQVRTKVVALFSIKTNNYRNIILQN
jgi:hypothetical protein